MFNYVFSSQMYLLSVITMADPGDPNGQTKVSFLLMSSLSEMHN